MAKSLLSSAAELSLLCTTENKEVPTANNLVLDDNLSAKSCMYIKKYSGPSIEPCGTPALNLFRMDIFWAAHGLFAPVPKICHISYNDEIWHSYTLPKKDPKNI